MFLRELRRRARSRVAIRRCCILKQHDWVCLESQCPPLPRVCLEHPKIHARDLSVTWRGQFAVVLAFAAIGAILAGAPYRISWILTVAHEALPVTPTSADWIILATFRFYVTNVAIFGPCFNHLWSTKSASRHLIDQPVSLFAITGFRRQRSARRS